MASKTKCNGRCQIGIAIFIFLSICIVIGVVVWAVLRRDKESPASPSVIFGNVELNKETLELKISTAQTEHLTGILGIQGPSESPTDCQNHSNENCFQWSTRQLEITTRQFEDVQCTTFYWLASSCVQEIFKDCFDFGNAHWYGGYEDFHQHWPLEKTVRNEAPFVVTDTYVNEIGQVQERYFISTQGIGIFIEHDVPLYISINESQNQKLCLFAKYEDYFPYPNPKSKLPHLRYHVCQAKNVRDIHDFMSNHFLKKPNGIPDELLFRYPIWSTWAQYHKDINQSIVLGYAEDILKYKFPHSQIEIDDDWTPKYGDLSFNTIKFPNATQMVKNLNNLGFRVTAWVHPFCNFDSDCFREGMQRGYFVRQFSSELPAPVKWWDGDFAGALDVTNTESVDWFLDKLKSLQIKYNISSFKFDAGGLSFIPKVYSFNKTVSSPNVYPELWARLANRSDPKVRHQEVRVGINTQDLPVFVRMLDLFSLWGRENGLEKLIPCALTFGILGYPFVLPDMIGGNAYDGRSPDKELFIRWLQATVFLPSIQFSIVPWNFNDAEVVNISRHYVELHANYSNRIIELAKESTQTGAPIVRPLWWVAPDDKVAQVIDSEFLLGDDILVAPVLQKGDNQRDIYIVSGMWRDMLQNTLIEGPKWIRNYTAELHELPYFERVSGV